MRENNRQQGFSALDVTLTVVLVCAIGMVGYFAWQNQHRSATQVSGISSSPTPTQTPNPAPIPQYVPPAPADWVTFTSSYNQASFEYPASWSFEKAINGPSTPDGYSQVTLTGPLGLSLAFRIPGRSTARMRCRLSLLSPARQAYDGGAGREGWERCGTIPCRGFPSEVLAEEA
jgi:hypothetical protein